MLIILQKIYIPSGFFALIRYYNTFYAVLSTNVTSYLHIFTLFSCLFTKTIIFYIMREQLFHATDSAARNFSGGANAAFNARFFTVFGAIFNRLSGGLFRPLRLRSYLPFPAFLG